MYNVLCVTDSNQLTQVRDEVKKQDARLVEFSKLPELERSRNIQRAEDTIK